MKPKTFELQIDETALFRRNEQTLKYLRERTTHFSYIKIEDGSKRVVPVLTYNCFAGYSELLAGFSTRYGGVSEGYLGSMNLSFTRGDKEEYVIKNHQLFAEAAGYDYSKLVFSDQVHETNIRVVKREDAGKGIVKQRDYEGVDGLVTDVANLPLMTFYADCVPLFFYDPQKRVVGLAHSGWRGTVAKIGTKMVETMHTVYGSDPGNIICAIGPSICKDCYEVSADVADEFRQNYSETEFTSMIINKGNGKYQLDLHLACYYNFVHAGVKTSHISMPDMCTCCNPQMFFSHRASGGQRGNLGAVIMLRE